MSVADAVYAYYDFLLDKKPLSLRGPVNIEPPPKAADYKMDDPDEARLYRNKKAAHLYLVEQEKQKQALQIIGYLVLRLMDLSPEEALVQFQVPGEAEKYIKAWKLDAVIAYVHFPPGIKKNNYKYLFSLAFPGRIRCDEDDVTLDVYHEVLSSHKPFPRNFFSYKAIDKLCVMLDDYIGGNIRISSYDELYDKFRDPAEGNKILKQARLFSAYRDYFQSPLAYVHAMLVGTGNANPVLFNVYSFLASYETAEKEIRQLKRGRKRAGKTVPDAFSANCTISESFVHI